VLLQLGLRVRELRVLDRIRVELVAPTPPGLLDALPEFRHASNDTSASGGPVRPVQVLAFSRISEERVVVPVATTRREAHELLLIEEADAWFEYLAATRGQTAVRYKEVEPWAWARLSQRLRAIRTKRQKLRPARAA
jgi:hypothetical protein